MKWSVIAFLLACVSAPTPAPAPAPTPAPAPASDITPELACSIDSDCVGSCDDTCCPPSCGCARVVNRETATRERATKESRCSAETIAQCHLHPCTETIFTWPRCQEGRCVANAVPRTI